MLELTGLSLWINIIIFAAGAIVIGVAGWKFTTTVDLIAAKTGIGEAIAGAVFLGATTSLSGSVLSAAAAWDGRAELAISNAIGGIAVQTAFLAIADIIYRRSNLEHAAASQENMLQGSLLLSLLAIPLLAATTPPITFWAINIATPILVIGYVYGMYIVHKAKSEPLWQPATTSLTDVSENEEDTSKISSTKLWITFVALGAVVGIDGFVLERSAVAIIEETGLSETAMGAVFTATSTSIPELVTSIAAVKRGALTLAVGGIVGGNSYDVLMVAFSDIFYRAGSVYHAFTEYQFFQFALTILLTGILLMGLLRRERHGIANIGFESFLVLIIYAVMTALLLFT